MQKLTRSRRKELKRQQRHEAEIRKASSQLTASQGATSQALERVNSSIVVSCHCVTGDKPAKWERFLPLAVAIIVAVIYYFQLDAMRTANRQARQALLQSDRPWIGLVEKNGGIAAKIEPNKPAQLVFRLTNYGKSPAQHTEIQTASGWTPPPKDYKFSELSRDFTGQQIGAFTVLPGQEVVELTSPTNSFVATDQQKQEMRDGKLVLFIYGQVTYQDWDGGEHVTHFCGALINDTIMEACSVYNDAS